MAEVELPNPEELHERREDHFARRVALVTAIFAVLLAIAALGGNHAMKEMILAQQKSSDQWAFYQAKGIKGAVAQGAISAWQAAGKEAPATLGAQSARYAAEQTEIQRRAGELERQRDERSREADRLLEQHHYFAAAVALFQIAIALGAISALTRSRLVWITSLVAGVAGIATMLLPVLHAP